MEARRRSNLHAKPKVGATMSDEPRSAQELTQEDEQGIVDIILLQAVTGDTSNIGFAISRWMQMPEAERTWTRDLAAKTRALLKDAFVVQRDPPQPTVTFDVPKLESFKKAYKHAVSADEDRFMFEGHEYVLGYAKYLIEYLEDGLRRTQ
jgi:hypothetical protein